MLELAMLAPHDGLRWYIGTIGFSYAEWKKVFYPEDMPARNYLRYYSRVFNAVEIDSTFYGIPKETTVRRWASTAPDGFKFCLKTPRSISHDSGLLDVESDMQVFLERVSILGDTLGVILLQLPPSFRNDKIDTLEYFLKFIPDNIRLAVEIRHPTWFEIPVGEREPMLAKTLREFGVCWAATEFPGLPELIYPTTDWIYIRWIGHHGRYKMHDHERVDMTLQLRGWCEQLIRVADELSEVYGFMNNDYTGFAVGTADKLKGILGIPRREYRPPKQATMF